MRSPREPEQIISFTSVRLYHSNRDQARTSLVANKNTYNVAAMGNIWDRNLVAPILYPAETGQSRFW